MSASNAIFGVLKYLIKGGGRIMSAHKMCRDFLSHLLGLPMGGNVHEMIKTDIYDHLTIDLK